MSLKKLVLIDGNSIMNRAFFGVPDLTNQQGVHTNAIYGFLNIMFKVLEEEEATNLLVAFDMKKPTFRHKMYDQYKGTRKPMPEELRQQMPLIKEILKAMNILVVEKEGIEADDILGTFARKGEREDYLVSVVSGDRDLLQLATEKITVRIPKSSKGTTTVEDYNTQQVIDKYGVTPLQIIDLKGLMGDSSDNIPGVPGIGEKTAVKILAQYESVENAIAHLDEMKNSKMKDNFIANKDLAILSKELATIKTDCEIEKDLSDTKIEDMFNKEAYEKISMLGIKSLLRKFEMDIATDEKQMESFQMIETEEAAKAFFNLLKKTKKLAIKAFVLKGKINENTEGQLSLFGEESSEHYYYAMVGDDKQSGFIRSDKGLPNAVIQDFLHEMIEKKTLIIADDLKSQLSILPLEDGDQCFDVGLAAYVINPVQNAYKEEDLAMEYAGVTMTPYSQKFSKKPVEKAFELDEEWMIQYTKYCAYVCYHSYEPLKKGLEECNSEKLYNEIELPLVFTLYDMERRGIIAKRQLLREYSESLNKQIVLLEKDIYAIAGEEFNINSPKQLGVILFEKMHLPYGKKTKTGYSTSAEVLEKLRLEDPIVDKVLEYRQLTKLKSTYADGLDVYIEEDGRIHSTFNQTITATGRISSTEPNLQNIPIRMELGRQIRKVFVPEEGYIFLDADYSQIELRVLAHMAGDKQLIEAYRKNADIHQTTASVVFHTPYDEVTSLQRRNAKAVNFGIVYGISGFGLSRDLNITKKEAEQYIKDYFSMYPEVKKFMDDQVTMGKEKGYVVTMYGRRRPIPEMSSANFMQRQFGERIAMNSPIQGSAADIIKIAMISVNRELKQRGLKSRLILQIHDELLIETAFDEKEEVASILQGKMEEAAALQVPLIAEVQEGINWYEAK